MVGDFYAKVRGFSASAKGARNKVVTFLLQHPEETAFMTIEELAAAAGVSTGMASRIVREIGFEGFADMQSQIRHVVRKNISPQARLMRAGKGGTSFRDLIRWEIRNLASVLKLNSEETVRNAAGLLAKAQAVHVMGLRTSFAPAFSLALSLGQIKKNVHLIDLCAGLLVEQIKRIAPGDLLFIISFPRYLRESLLMAQEAKKKSCPIVTITDSFSSPLAMQADVALLAPYESTSFFNSVIAMHGIVNAMITETARILGDKSARELEEINCIQKRWNMLVSVEEAWNQSLPGGD